MTQWCRHLPEFGWQPVVMCRHYGFTATAEMLARDVHPEVVVRYLNEQRLGGTIGGSLTQAVGYRIKRLVSKPARAVTVPDQSMVFWRRIRQQVLAQVNELQPDAILTTSPPHANHDIGLWLATQTDIPWVADFRDPFMIDPRFTTGAIRRLRLNALRRMEAAVYERATLILHAIPLHARWARQAYPSARRRIRLLPNGVPQLLAEGSLESSLPRDGRRSIRVIGVPGDNVIWTAAQAVRQLVHLGHDVDLRLVGRPPKNLDEIRRILGNRIDSLGTVPHRTALNEVIGADVLLCLLDPERSEGLGLSSKLFEYLAVPTPIVVINPTRSDRRFLSTYPGVQSLYAPSANQIVAALERALDTPREALQRRADAFVREYGRRSQVALLAEWLSGVVSSQRPPVCQPTHEP